MANGHGDDDAILLDPRRNQCMEKKKLFEEMLLKEMPGTSRANEPMHAVLEGELGESEMVEGREAQNVRNRALLHYLASLANSNSTKDTFDFDFVESLLKNGADVHSADKTGQTVFHEVARSWNIDVAKFLINNGADVNQQDQYGRSPLHVAAAVDYAEMVEFLQQNGADIEIKTTGEGQTAMHFAAKNDAINSIQMLLGYGADIDARDSKNRTPLQVAAEMNRSKVAKLLITEGAPAGVYDNLGNSALSLLIEKIPEVALDAMDQFHSVDTINRKEFYFLNYLEGTKLQEEQTHARTPLEIAVQNERYDVVMHPVMRRLIGVKWQIYGKWGAILDLVLNLIYTILWTVLAVTLPKHGRDLYIPLKSNVWRLVIVFILILLTLVEIRKQIINTIITRHEHKAWKEWRASELERDIEFCHPRWPQETKYVNAEIKAVRNLSLMSGSDYWIYFDWIALAFILATIVSHVIFFHYSTDLSKEVHHYIIMPLLLILWYRMFKYARPFEGAGPFIVIFGSVISDIIKWGFFNIIIFIPFACAFWLTFGSISSTPVKGYDKVGPLLYNIFSMMVGGEHHFKELEKKKPFMARLLCGSFIAVGAIVSLNLLIALLTNTFERLYENAIANAVMQRARTILLLEKSLWRKQEAKYYDFIKKNASPEIITKNIGRLLSLEREEATIERVHDDVKGIASTLTEKFGKKFRKGKKSDLDFVRMDVSKVRRFQEEIVIDVRKMKLSLDEMKGALREIIINNNINKNKQTSNQDDDDDNTISNGESKHNDSSSSSDNDDDGNVNKNSKTKENIKGNNPNNKKYKKIGSNKKVNSKEKEILNQGESSMTTSPKKVQTVMDKTSFETKSPNKTEVKPRVLKKPDVPPKSSRARKAPIEPKGEKNTHIGERRKKFEENTESDTKKRNIDHEESQYDRTDKRVEQTNETGQNEEYDTIIPYGEDDMPENELEGKKLVYPAWPLPGMCQQVNTSSNGTFPQPCPQFKHDHQQKLDLQMHPVKQESHQVIKSFVNIDHEESQYDRTDKRVEQINETGQNEEYDTIIPYGQDDMPEKELEGKKLVYPAWPLPGMCQQVNTSSNGTFPQPCPQFKHNHQQKLDLQMHPVKQESHQVIKSFVNIDHEESQYDRTDKRVEQINETGQNEEYDTIIPYGQDDMPEKELEGKKLVYPAWPLPGMCQQVNTSSNGTFPQPCPQFKHDHQQQLHLQMHPVKQESHQVIKSFVNIDHEESQYDRTDKRVEQTNETGQNEEYDTIIPYGQADMPENELEGKKLVYQAWPLPGMCQQVNTSSNGTFPQPCPQFKYDHQQQLDLQMHPVKQESHQLVQCINDQGFPVILNVEKQHPVFCTNSNTKCLQFHAEHPKEICFGQLPHANAERSGQSYSEMPISHVQTQKSTQFSSEPNYSSPKRNKMVSYSDFDVSKKMQKQHSCESCNCRSETEGGLQIPTTRHQDVQDENISTNYEGSLWKNLRSEDPIDNEQQSFSSTYLHFNDDSGCCSHSVQPTSFSRTRLSGRRRTAQQTKNENIGSRSTHLDSVMVEMPYVERIYKKIPGINSEFSTNEGNW